MTPYESPVTVERGNWFADTLSNIGSLFSAISRAVTDFAIKAWDVARSVASFVVHPVQSIKAFFTPEVGTMTVSPSCPDVGTPGLVQMSDMGEIRTGMQNESVPEADAIPAEADLPEMTKEERNIAAAKAWEAMIAPKAAPASVRDMVRSSDSDDRIVEQTPAPVAAEEARDIEQPPLVRPVKVDVLTRIIDFVVQIPQTVKQHFAPLPATERVEKLKSAVASGQVYYDALGGRELSSDIPQIRRLGNYFEVRGWRDVKGYPVKVVDYGKMFIGTAARFAVGGDMGAIDRGLAMVPDSDDSVADNQNFYRNFGRKNVAVGSTRASIHQDGATLAYTAVVSLQNTYASGEGLYFVHYQTKGSQQRWWVSNAKRYASDGVEVSPYGGMILDKQDAYRYIGIRREDL